MSVTEPRAIDETQLNELLGRAVGDLGATLGATLVVIGDRLGLFRGLDEGEHDPAISRTWFQCPPIRLDGATPGMDAVRVSLAKRK